MDSSLSSVAFASHVQPAGYRSPVGSLAFIGKRHAAKIILLINLLSAIVQRLFARNTEYMRKERNGIGTPAA